jgi:uncharacterized protein
MLARTPASAARRALRPHTLLPQLNRCQHLDAITQPYPLPGDAGIFIFISLCKKGFIFEHMIHPDLYIGPSPKGGRGVFTEAAIAAGTVIECSPVIVMTGTDRVLLDQTLLHDYIFEWGEKHDQCCMALGWIPLYNHDYQSNCEYFMDYSDATMEIKTVRAIAAGEELTINYNGDWNNSKPVWFEVNGTSPV